MKQPKVKGVPVDYMDIQTLWNDRRDPHANPVSSSPRRTVPRQGPGKLQPMIDQIYRGQPTHTVGDE
jgi:hypothetical protein